MSEINEKEWNDLEKRADSQFKIANKFGIRDLEGIDKKLDELIKIKDRKLNKIVDNSGYSDFETDNAMDNRDIKSSEHIIKNPVVQKVSQPVTEEEKMIVLELLQDKKITAEEADRLLQALEQ